jgi:predicted O-linked N-acetylglucosamine transferase (SPINDLY family)
MFFPRLRNQAKWAFVFLIVVFGGGFIFLGVGSGGLDLGQLIRDAFGNRGASTGSVSDAQKAVQERPLNALARKKLAQVLESKGRTDEAVSAWLEYGKLRPRDTAALRHLGDLELSQANVFLQQAQLASLAQTEAAAGAAFRPASGGLAQALGQDPLAAAQTSKASAEFQLASTRYQTSATRAISTYQQITKLEPKNQEAMFALAQAADNLHQTTAAVGAYKRLLKLNLDPTTKAQIRERIKTLQSSPQG